MDYIDGRRGKRKVKRSCRSSPADNIPLRNDLLERFVPVTLLRGLSDMTCTLKNKDSETGSPSTCTYHRCDSCPQAFCSEEEYEQHSRTDHPAQAPPAEEKIRPSRSSTLTCRTCKYTAPDGNKAAMHEKLHRDQKLGVAVFKCKACKFLSCSKMGITIHKRLEHAPLKYECPMCNYSSFNARHVTAHVDKVHCNPEQENWGCPYCSAQLDTGLKLKLHLQNEHIDESQFKEFTCDLCDYSCYTNTDIVHHMKAHRAKKKLFKCQKCLFISVKFDKYAKHLDLIHGQIETEECHKEELVPPKQEEKGNIPVIRVIQKKEPECRPPPEADEVDINNVMYTPPTSPVIKSDPVVKSDPGNIFDKMSLKNQEKAKVCRAVGLRASPRKKSRHIDSKTGRLLKLRNSSQGLNGRRSLKRCRYCTTKTMFDTLTKLREHHIKAHGINELGVQLGLRQYRCKYCPEKREFDGIQALKDHYSECHPDASVRRLVKRSKSFQDESTQSTGFETAEIAKVKPSLIDEIEIAETSCETKRQDMLDCILQSQKQIGKALKDSSPECNLSQSVTKSRIGRINSAPSTIYDNPPTVKPVIFSTEERLPHKNTASSAPTTPHIPSARQDNTSSSSTDKIIPDYQHIVGNSIYNLSLSELQYLQQQYYIYQAYCLNMYYNDPVYRQYVQEKQQEILLQHSQKVREVPDPVPDRTYTPRTQRPIVKISDPRSLAQPSSARQPTVGLELTKPKLGSPRNPNPQPATAHTHSRIHHQCLVAACPYTTNRLLDLKKHISVEHNVRITETMEAQLEELIRAQEGTRPQEERRAPEKVVPDVTIANHSYPCSHCSLKLGSFDAYVQHMIEVHRNELGIISQGSMPNTFNTHHTGPPKTAVSNSAVNNTTSPSKAISTTPPTVTIKSDPQSCSKSCAEPGSSSSSVNGSASGGFECTSCYHVAQSAEALKRHEKVHSNTYHKCSVCEYIAPSEGTLQVHMNIHKS